MDSSAVIVIITIIFLASLNSCRTLDRSRVQNSRAVDWQLDLSAIAACEATSSYERSFIQVKFGSCFFRSVLQSEIQPVRSHTPIKYLLIIFGSNADFHLLTCESNQ